MALFPVVELCAQTIKGIPYQTVVRDEQGNPVADQELTVRFYIQRTLSTRSGAQPVTLYSETHTATSDANGLVRLQVGEVIASERVKKSEKLLKNTVRVGEQTRTVVSGIAKFYSPEEMVGKKVVLVTNLKPAKLCGILSEGMILCAEDAEGKLSLLSPEKDMASGSGIF